MSVTIVSVLPKPTPASADNNAVAGSDPSAQDFASLLKGQLPPVAPKRLQDLRPDKDPADAEAAPADAASLLAGLGIVPVPLAPADTKQIKDGALPVTDALGKIAAGSAHDTQAAGQSLSALTDAAKQAAQSAERQPFSALADAAKNDVTAGQTPVAADKPAIIAANAAIVADVKAEALPAAAADTAPNTTAAFSVNAPVGANVPAPHSDLAMSVPTSIRNHAWAADFSQKVVWLATSDKQAAQLTLNPPQMGPIEISMRLEKGNATASFFSANAEVRDAIETAMPRLREMFANAGINLGQTNVSAESFKQASANEYGGGSRSSNDNAILVADSGGSLPGRPLSTMRGNGMVDIFA